MSTVNNGPQIVRSGLVLDLDASSVTSYPAIAVYKVECYSVYNGGLRSANYTVQYSDDNSTWTTAFTGVMSNNSTCGIITGTNRNDSNYSKHRYWRYVEGAAVAGHHPRVSRIDLITKGGARYNLITYTTDNCSDSGTYIVGTVSKDFVGSIWYDMSGNRNNGTLYNSPTFNNTNGGNIIFNGTNNYLQANINSNILDGDPDFSVEFFVKRTADFVSSGFWGIGGAGQGYSIEGWTPTTNEIHLDLYDSTRLSSGVSYPLNTWVHVVWAKSGSQISTSTTKLYVNSNLSTLTLTRAQTTGPRYNTSTAGVGISLGRINGDANNNYAPITIGFFRVYSRQLSSLEVSQNYQATKTRFGL
jgi:hypothetical protein